MSGLIHTRRKSLNRKVTRACGDGSQFERIHIDLDLWIRTTQPSQPIRDRVEPYLAHYLAEAARVGLRWGIAAGLAAGLLLSACVVLMGWITWMVI